MKKFKRDGLKNNFLQIFSFGLMLESNSRNTNWIVDPFTQEKSRVEHMAKLTQNPSQFGEYFVIFL